MFPGGFDVLNSQCKMTRARLVGGGSDVKMHVLRSGLKPSDVQTRASKGGWAGDWLKTEDVTIKQNGSLRVGHNDRDMINTCEVHPGNLRDRFLIVESEVRIGQRER